MLSATVFAQVGGIRGSVSDADFEVPLPGVMVRLSETGQEVETGEGGSYYLENIEPGAYTLLFSKGGYTRVTRPEVVVVPGQLAEVDTALAGEYEEMDELVVRDIQLGGASEIGLLNMRMESLSMMDSVGADMMSQAGASDAAQALQLVPGTTVQDGKYAVVRGLPDRYVSAQMNGVRLPSADPNKRAVQLDQFPSAMIESMQVTKTFTPDQQGDASGGAVNVVLKGIPDERVLKAGIGLEFNSQVVESGDQFLTYKGGGVDFWGRDDSRNPQTPGTPWTGAVGVSRDDYPPSYKWSVLAGDKYTFDSGVKVGAVGSFFYKRKASCQEGREDTYWVLTLDRQQLDNRMTPRYSAGDPLDEGEDTFTALYDSTKATEEVQWGSLGAIGLESENHTLNLLYSYNSTTEDTAVLLENTRGKYYYFPTHDPNDQTSPGHFDDDRIGSSPFTRNESLIYTEREADTLQLRGTHVFPIPEVGVDGWVQLLDPKIDWTAARSTSSLTEPDKRVFASAWYPGYFRRGIYRDPVHRQPPTDSNTGVGNLQRTWKSIEEDSLQFFANGELPFEQWSGDKGMLKTGLFRDSLKRTFDQDSYSNNESAPVPYAGEWEEYWSADFPYENVNINEALVDVDYEGDQDITAVYGMVDLPLSSFLSVIGGARLEKTKISTTITDADAGNVLKLYLPPNYSGVPFNSNREEANVDYQQDDVLPALGFELRPFEKWMLRASYSETVARQTFRELTPIQQQEYLGGDIFIGNPYLTMSELKNYDLRLDYTPYPGGLFSCSWFYKDITDPIEYKQVLLGGANLATTADNYPEGNMNGFEFEVRQSLGRFWRPMEGLSIGGNLTLIDSEVTLPQDEQDLLFNQFGVMRSSRNMLNAPEMLYNINATYTIPSWGTDLGLFYTVKGDTLIVGAGNDNGNYAPDIYEKERGILNFTVSKQLGNHFKLSFKAKNLTDTPVEEVYRADSVSGDVVRRSYRKGIDYVIELGSTW